MNELINGNAIKMTSIEIAELVGKRHDNVKRTIETLAKNGVIRLPQIEVSERINNLGFNVQYEHYVFEGEQGSDCHAEIDRRTMILDNKDARLYHLEGVIRTQAILLKEGKIKP